MIRKTANILSLSGETEWLGRVREVRLPLDLAHPLRIWRQLNTDDGRLPRPTVPHPERHPYCEVNFVFEGRGEQFIGMEKVMRTGGDMMLLGPGIPHRGTILTCPHYVIVVHFLPVLLLELSPRHGAQILARFTANRSISQRVVRPPKALQAQFATQFENMVEEFESVKFGSDVCVRALLMDILIKLMRWEESSGKALSHQSNSSNWAQIEKILHIIHERYTEPLYVEQIAREVGLSTSGLHKLFRAAFGMSCIQYLTAYRISHAAALLCLPGARVIDVAPVVGYESLSHFNSAFRRFQGMSPREYIRAHKPR